MTSPGGDSRNDLFLVVARAPVAGFTKTRLGESIGMEPAAELYLAFLHDIAATFFAAGALPERIATGWAYTPDSFDFAQLVSGFLASPVSPETAFIAQEGEGLAARLTHLFAWATDHGYERTVIMASDSPQLPLSVACEALDALVDHDLVIGRVVDGGYYLIGSRGPTSILLDVPMSTIDAAQALVDTATARGLSVAELAPDFDVDVAGDLELLIVEARVNRGRLSATARALERLGYLEAVTGTIVE